jgi:methionyl-tRNA formyltransferase
VIVKNPWTKKRIFSEFRRDRARLLKKAYEKMILGDTRYHEDDPETILSKARQANLTASDLESLSKECGYKYSLVNDHNDRESENILEKSRPDIIVFTGGGMIRKNILSIPNIGILNCHSGILPRFRGMDVVEWPAVEQALDIEGIGLTVHFMDQGLDTGPILLQKKLSLRKDDTFLSIRMRLESFMADLVLEGVKGLVQKNIQMKEQKVDDGKQYFVMHPRIYKYAQNQLKQYLNQK